MHIKKKLLKPSGFTIVELLIVIVVIAILAAITIVAYNGIQNRANDTAVKSDLKTIAKKLALYRANNSSYPSNIGEAIASDELYKIVVSKSAYYTDSDITFNFTYCSMSPYTDYAVLAMSKSGARLYILNGSLGEYTGSTDWKAASGIATICRSVLAGSTNAGTVGYNVQSGVSSPGWRAWTGVSS